MDAPPFRRRRQREAAPQRLAEPESVAGPRKKRPEVDRYIVDADEAVDDRTLMHVNLMERGSMARRKEAPVKAMYTTDAAGEHRSSTPPSQTFRAGWSQQIPGWYRSPSTGQWMFWTGVQWLPYDPMVTSASMDGSWYLPQQSSEKGKGHDKGAPTMPSSPQASTLEHPKKEKKDKPKQERPGKSKEKKEAKGDKSADRKKEKRAAQEKKERGRSTEKMKREAEGKKEARTKGSPAREEKKEKKDKKEKDEEARPSGKEKEDPPKPAAKKSKPAPPGPDPPDEDEDDKYEDYSDYTY